MVRFIAIFSDNDPYVSLENETIFKEKLNAKTSVVSGKGHMTEDDGVKDALVIKESVEEFK